MIRAGGVKKLNKLTALTLAVALSLSTMQLNTFAVNGILNTLNSALETVTEKLSPSIEPEGDLVATATEAATPTEYEGPVFVRKDLTATPTELIEVPAWYVFDEELNCYLFEDRDGDVQYRVYGHYNNDNDGWYEYNPDSDGNDAYGLEVVPEDEYKSLAPLHYSLFDEDAYTDDIWERLYSSYSYISDASKKAFTAYTPNNYGYDEELNAWKIQISDDQTILMAYGKADNDETSENSWICFTDLELTPEENSTEDEIITRTYTSFEDIKAEIEDILKQFETVPGEYEGYQLSEKSYQILSAWMEAVDNAYDEGIITDDEYDEISNYLSDRFDELSVYYEEFRYDPYKTDLSFANFSYHNLSASVVNGNTLRISISFNEFLSRNLPTTSGDSCLEIH